MNFISVNEVAMWCDVCVCVHALCSLASASSCINTLLIKCAKNKSERRRRRKKSQETHFIYNVHVHLMCATHFSYFDARIITIIQSLLRWSFVFESAMPSYSLSLSVFSLFLVLRQPSIESCWISMKRHKVFMLYVCIKWHQESSIAMMMTTMMLCARDDLLENKNVLHVICDENK